MSKWTFQFGGGKAEGKAEMLELLGGKGANLAEMSNIGVSVPPGFTISTKVCNYYYENNFSFPEGLWEEVDLALLKIQEISDSIFGDIQRPLLLSVRSGARASMPGMMDTVLNLGLNDETVKGLSIQSGDERFAYDSYRRFIQMYGNVVLGIEYDNFEEIIDDIKHSSDFLSDTELTGEDWKGIVKSFKNLVFKTTGKNFPQNPKDQLIGAIESVLKSWMNQRAITYRKLNNIPSAWGTAINVQSMVFGNMGNSSCTGVAFTRNPSTGESEYYGEYLINAQGEDVVAGIRTPQPLNKPKRNKNNSKNNSMEETMPNAYSELTKIFSKLELHYKDVQDIEFTVQKNKLWILQTRSAKRTTLAAIKIAVDMVKEGKISKEKALMRISPNSLDQLLHPRLDSSAKKKIVSKGLPASPGAASGQVVFNPDSAESLAKKEINVILVRIETSPEDIHGMHAAKGILTSRGGMTSHAAVVARGMGRPCVSGATELKINYDEKSLYANGYKIKEGDTITIDGSTGEVILGEVPTLAPEMSKEFLELMQWADRIRQLKIRANAETLSDAKTAKNFGAEGIGLCRTEHMFFDLDRISEMRKMILANKTADRKKALENIAPMQRQDFLNLFREMKDLPITVRLLDPPLHEFLPKGEVEIKELAENLGKKDTELASRIRELSEQNPMLGHRGCRLGISFPEIYDMQVRSIFEAMASLIKHNELYPQVEIMIPLVFSKEEIDIIKSNIYKVVSDIEEKEQISLNYLIGTMIELPRAALCADEIAKSADFFSFGTNDLTQTSLGISRDDSASFLTNYTEKGILKNDPFVSLDQSGVGELIKIGINKGRSSSPDLKIGICGEHGGDPESVIFCHICKLDYVSCSPYRVPVARLAAAQAAIDDEK